MKEIYREMVRLCQAGDAFALATVVGTSGSTPRNLGAKFLVYPDGGFLGSVGGGCIEAEIWQEARDAIKSGRTVIKEFSLNDESAAESGLVCGGTMAILIETIGDRKWLPQLREIRDALEGKRAPLAVATLVGPSKRTAARLGARMMIEEGGSLPFNDPEALFQEPPVIKAVRDAFSASGPQHVSVKEDELYIEVFRPPETLLIFGAGHIAEALCPMARVVGFRVVVVDDRELFANRERFREANEIIVAPMEATARSFPVSSRTFVVIATRGHQLDYEVLREVVKSPAPYIGVIGSKRKSHLTYQQLAAENIPPEKLSALHIPVGLDLGAETPEEIAVCIISEILMEKRRGDGRPLRLSPGLLSRET